MSGGEQLSFWTPTFAHPRQRYQLAALAAQLDADPDLVARYRAKVWTAAGPDACHLWMGALNGGTGHAKIHIRRDADGKEWMDYGHRIGWILGGGDITPDLLVRHTCDEPPCQNFAHYEAGSVWDNSQDWTNRRHRIDSPLADPRGAYERAKQLQHAVRDAGDDPAAQVAAYRAAARRGLELSGQLSLLDS